MTERRPIVVADGDLKELPVDDTLPITDSFTADFGDGVATTYDIIHNLNTLDVEVQFRRNTVPRSFVLIDHYALDVNTTRVLPSNPPGVNELRYMGKRAS